MRLALPILPVIMGLLLDFLLGDPRWLYHPVRLIGHLIHLSEKVIRGLLPGTKAFERAGGFLLVIIVTGCCLLVPWVILYKAYHYNIWLGVGIETWMCYRILACKSLRTESEKVYEELNKNDLKGARYAVSMIVGRDTKELDEEGVAKAAVETVAENTSDGVISPLFYMFIGGAVLGFAFKAVNTMDSMVGYKNDKYKYFGTAAAKLDDVLNYLPSRICAWIMIGVCPLFGMNYKNAGKIYLRDRRNHKSPNAAQTESVMAGALEVQLAGNAYYFGKLYEKKTIGDDIRTVEPQDIIRAGTLLYGTAVAAVFLFAGLRLAVTLFIR